MINGERRCDEEVNGNDVADTESVQEWSLLVGSGESNGSLASGL